MDTKPIQISLPEWKEIIQLKDVKDAWGLEEDETPEQFADMVYGVKFHFTSGSPGYVGDLYILHGDALGEPMTLIREDGRLVVLAFYGRTRPQLPLVRSSLIKTLRTLQVFLDRDLL